MKKNCDMIRDLMPLYIDEVCSKESKEYVEKHLQECKECQNYLEKLKENLQNVRDDKEVNTFKKFIKTVNFKIVRNSLLITIVILVLLIFGSRNISNHKFSIEYNDNMEIIYFPKTSYNNRWNFQFSTYTDGYAYGTYVKTEENGQPVNLIFITWQTNFFGNKKRDYKLSAGPDLDYASINPEEEMRVYYTTEDLAKIKSSSKKDLAKIIAKSKLIFTKDTKSTTINCHLENKEYNYTLTYYDINKQIIKSEGDDLMPRELLTYIYAVEGDYNSIWFPGDKYNDIEQKINDYMTKNGGSCKEIDA